MSANQEPRRYGLPPLVRAGLFGGMPATQVAVLRVGAAVSFLGLLADLFPWAALPLLGAAFVAFGRAGPYQLHELIPLKVSWWRRRNRGSCGGAAPSPSWAPASTSPWPSPRRCTVERVEVNGVQLGGRCWPVSCPLTPVCGSHPDSAGAGRLMPLRPGSPAGAPGGLMMLPYSSVSVSLTWLCCPFVR